MNQLERPAAARREDAIRNLLIKQYHAHGSIPWTEGYLLYREQFISETLRNPDLLSMFRLCRPLPAGYGLALDERCVEYPWLFSRLEANPARILDAGSALNHKFLLDNPVWQFKKMHILTLAPETSCFWDRGISYLFEDLRNIPVRDNFYDMVICISTVEHIGFDNRAFTGDGTIGENNPDGFIAAMREMRRVLKSKGQLLLTVPFGRYRNIGTQQVFNKDLLEKTIAAFGPGEVSKTFFAYSGEGWQFADVHKCSECDYVDWIMLPSNLRPQEFPVQPDGAAAARAVACVRLEK